MLRRSVAALNAVLQRWDLKLVRPSTERQVALARGVRVRDWALLELAGPEHAAAYLQHVAHSQAQLRQDLFVLSALGFKRNGFFVEFGAADGVQMSNTHLLEQYFGWTGILAEPARVWHEALRRNRSAHIDHGCVWTETGESLAFVEARNAEFSTLGEFVDHDLHAGRRRQGSESYRVSTISLVDLLGKHGAPREIDYLSIDTEGSEFEILEAFDWQAYRFKVITCEHNHDRARSPIHRLLTAQGYRRVLVECSEWDDWYVADEVWPRRSRV